MLVNGQIKVETIDPFNMDPECGKPFRSGVPWNKSMALCLHVSLVCAVSIHIRWGNWKNEFKDFFIPALRGGQSGTTKLESRMSG